MLDKSTSATNSAQDLSGLLSSRLEMDFEDSTAALKADAELVLCPSLDINMRPAEGFDGFWCASA